jgi:myosin-crossreactive antigen
LSSIDRDQAHAGRSGAMMSWGARGVPKLILARNLRAVGFSRPKAKNQKGIIMTDIHRSASRSDTKAYLVGGGIAALASAAYLIRDGGLPGPNISILEQTSLLGGSLDGAGSPDHGYVIRGGRMFTYEAYTCTFDLLSFVPSLTDPARTVSDEIHAFNNRHIPESHARLVRGGAPRLVAVDDDDLVFVTNGSMTTASSLGSMTRPAELTARDGETDGSWALWETLAKKHAEFGRPAVFNSKVDESKWLSFTVTMRDPTFFDLMEKFTGNAAGTGGLVTFTDSNWLMSVVLAAQPHFIGQPNDIKVFWGYGLFVDQVGNFVNKKMSECSGEELLTELLGHLRFDEHKSLILKTSNCIPCMMPYITSQFMPRVKGDRPEVRPAGTTNIAFIGQYCEIPDDVVFTVEYSVRAAQTAVFALLDLDKKVSPLYKAQYDPAVLFGATKTLLHA